MKFRSVNQAHDPLIRHPNEIFSSAEGYTHIAEEKHDHNLEAD
jgi:hypothetical protein